VSVTDRVMTDTLDRRKSMRESRRGATLSIVKMLIVDITAPGQAGGRLGRYKVSERREDGSLVLVPETVEEVIAETTDRPLDGDEFLDALDRLAAASSSSQQPG
jgi:hypothetical protein